jgi:hypothetical protein
MTKELRILLLPQEKDFLSSPRCPDRLGAYLLYCSIGKGKGNVTPL